VNSKIGGINVWAAANLLSTGCDPVLVSLQLRGHKLITKENQWKWEILN